MILNYLVFGKICGMLFNIDFIVSADILKIHLSYIIETVNYLNNIKITRFRKILVYETAYTLLGIGKLTNYYC